MTWTAWSPALHCPGASDPALGSTGSAVGRYKVLDNDTVVCWAKYRFSGSGVSKGSGLWVSELPFALVDPGGGADSFQIGAGVVGSGFTHKSLTVHAYQDGLWRVMFAVDDSLFLTNTTPFGSGPIDNLHLWMEYEKGS